MYSVPKSPTKLGPHLCNRSIAADIGNLKAALVILGKMKGGVDVYAFCRGVNKTLILSGRDKRCLSVVLRLASYTLQISKMHFGT